VALFNRVLGESIFRPNRDQKVGAKSGTFCFRAGPYSSNNNKQDNKEQSQQSSYYTNYSNNDLKDVPKDKEVYIDEVINI
jgi:hypothetical protein